MSNANEPAMPTTGIAFDDSGNLTKVTKGGLTKREEIAKAALAGILTSRDITTPQARITAARQAVASADALLAELEATR